MTDPAGITPLSAFRLGAQGYQPGPGPRSLIALVDGVAIDEDVCRQSHCRRRCNIQGLEYHPYYRPGSYRAFAVCPKCGDTQEF